MPKPAIPELAGLIAASGLTNAEIARRAQISRVYLSSLVHNRFNPSQDVAERLANVLGTTISALGVRVSNRHCSQRRAGR